MLTTTLETVYQCGCDNCGHHWKSLITPVSCPKCFTRTWNGAKTRGRPRNPLKADQPPSTRPRRTRTPRKELTEYSKEW